MIGICRADACLLQASHSSEFTEQSWGGLMSDYAGWQGWAIPNIEAFLNDGTYQLFTPHDLDSMLDRNQVRQFKRSTGWVIVGVDPVRVRRGAGASSGYTGLERRVSSRGFPKVIP